MAVHRNRVIYQSEALFISPDSTGYHFTGSAIPNAEVPSDYADISANIGPGPFGLMTPPTGIQQVFGGTAVNPAKNHRGEIMGWKAGDKWPEWNPRGDAGVAGVKSKTVLAGNVGGEITLEADRTGDSYDGIILELVQAAATSIGFNPATKKLSVEMDFGAGVSYDGLLAVFASNNGVTALSSAGGFSVAKGPDPTAFAQLTTANDGINFTAQSLGPTKNGITFTINQGAVLGATFAGGNLVIQADVGGGATYQDIIDYFGTAAGTAVLVAADFAVAGVGDPSVGASIGNAVSAGAAAPIVGLATTAGGFDGIKYAKAHGTIIKQLKRIQTANYGFTISREDVNQFGHLSRLDSVVIEAPTVNLDFSYYLLDGFNERHIEMITDGVTNALSGGFSPELYQAGSNFFILTMPEAGDAVNGDVRTNVQGEEHKKSVISLGNGYITDYTVDIAVGSIPTANVTVEGMNIKSDIGETGNDLPSINMADGSFTSSAWSGDANGNRVAHAAGCTGLYSLPAAVSGYDGCGDVAALRPGDVVLDLKDAGLISRQVSGETSKPTVGSAHVQSVSISVPQARSTLQRLGSTFGFSKTLDVPINITMSVSATLSDLKEGNMADLLCGCDKIDASVTMYDPECVECTTKDEAIALRFDLKGARLESENFTSTIGDNKTVDLTLIAQIAGADDPDNGLFISGKESSEADVKGIPPAWTGIGGAENIPTSGLMGFRS
jgi:hypothetical protein